MRSAVLLRLAFGLLAVDTTVAGPCIPGTTTTAVTSTASTETSSSITESSTLVVSATSSVTTESSVETSVSSTTTQSSAETSSSTVSVETSASSTTSAETSASSATETTVSSATTDSTTTTSDMTTSTTSTAPTITFDIVAAGSGPVEGKGLQTYTNKRAVALFRNDIDSSSSVRPFHLDAQGRLFINDLGYYLCGYYEATNFDLDYPAEVGTCVDEYPLDHAFLRCQQTADLKLTCSIPAITCVATGDPDDFFDDPTCQAAAGTWDNLYTAVRGPGVVLHIGVPNAGSDFDPVELGIQVV